jgi:hypothetical protein
LLLPVYADPDRIAGKAESALKELRLNLTKTDRLLDPAVSDRTWPEGTGVNRLSSSLILRVTKHPEVKLADTRHRGKLHGCGAACPEPSI